MPIQLTADQNASTTSNSMWFGGHRCHAVLEGYRFGFNNKENDNEVAGLGNWQDYGMRMYSPRLGRFPSVDPLTAIYPELTPYQFASNTPIQAIDLDGGEAKIVITNVHYGRKSFLGRVNDQDVYSERPNVRSETTTYLPGSDGYNQFSDNKKLGTRGTLIITTYTSDENGGLPDYSTIEYELGILEALNPFKTGNHRPFGYLLVSSQGQGGETATSDHYVILDIDKLLGMTNGFVSGKGIKTFTDAMEWLNKAYQQGENIATVLEEAGAGDYLREQIGKIEGRPTPKFICPTCSKPFAASDTTEHNNSLNRQSGPFTPVIEE
jgi:RHS repeat-associated protein